ncbi:MAG: hypothetical protein RL885_09965 [Planctomycetota bacterium]
MAEIFVTAQSSDEFLVSVQDEGGTSTHLVRVTPESLERYGEGQDAETLLEKSFEFLLEREPKESILSRFELPVIESYFPEYPGEIRSRLA